MHITDEQKLEAYMAQQTHNALQNTAFTFAQLPAMNKIAAWLGNKMNPQPIPEAEHDPRQELASKVEELKGKANGTRPAH